MSLTTWKPSLGAWPEGGGFRFRVWAPEVRSLELQLGIERKSYRPQKQADGTWTIHVPGCEPGAQYRYLVEGKGPFPDPATRFQPEGIHGPSQTVALPSSIGSGRTWTGLPMEGLVFYELHVGTFTPEGTFDAVAGRLATLRDLGVNAIELMPVADFPGERNWGYDGVCPFAPARCYGSPEAFQRLVYQAHEMGLAVFLDVVYNHLGPDGNYTGVYSPYYISKKHHTPWGDALNFDGAHSRQVREFFVENALHWIHDYQLDGLRLDATHAIHDDSEEHILAELARRVKGSLPEGRHVHLIAEDHRNLAHMVRPRELGGWGLDGIWADDFHHEVRCHVARDREGYYCDYSGSMEDLATTINQGWFFTGQHSDHLNESRGSDPKGLPQSAFVVCLQNHDQIGNRAFGERLHHEIDLAAYRAVSVLLLCGPATPLLFMGQEWACTAPFRFFSDHHHNLGLQVTEGRRREFRHFSAFADPLSRERIPDPQAPETFAACRLDWDEARRTPHCGVRELYQTLLALRLSEPALRNILPGSFHASRLGDTTLFLERRDEDGCVLGVVCNFKGPTHSSIGRVDGEECCVLLTTEDSRFCDDPQPLSLHPSDDHVAIRFQRPGAVLFCRANNTSRPASVGGPAR